MTEERDVAGGPRTLTPPEVPLAYRAVRGGLWVAGSSYFNIGFGFLVNLALVRILDPEHFGLFALAQFFFSLVDIKSVLGLGRAYSQRKETTGQLAGTYLGLACLSSAGTLLLAFLAVPVLHLLGYPSEVVWITVALAGAGMLHSLANVAGVMLDKELHLRHSSLVTSLTFPLSYIPAFWLALRGAGVWSLVAGNAAYAALLLPAMWWTARRRLPSLFQLRWRFDRDEALRMLRFGVMVGLASLAAMIVSQFDNFLVGTFVSVTTLGFYTRAYQIAQWPTFLVGGVLDRSAYYTYTRLQDDPPRLKKTVTMVLWLTTTLALPLALAVFAAAPDLVAMLYGERWRPSGLFVRFLVVFSVLKPLLGNAAAIFIATGRPRLATKVRAIQAGVLILLGTPLTLGFDAVGTCIGVGIAFLIGLVVSYSYVQKAVDVSLWDAFAGPTLAALLAMGAYLLFTWSVDLNVLPLALRVAVKGAFAGGAFVAILLALQPRRSVERLRYVYSLLRAGRAG